MNSCKDLYWQMQINSVKGKIRKHRLKRELSLFQATVYGVGIILGAGIYALIGAGAGLAGNMLWASFIVAAVIACFTGLSYAELSSLYPKEAAEYVYTRKAFSKKSLSLFVGLVMIFSGVVSAATVAVGFGNYFSYLFSGSPVLIAGALILLLSLLNYRGIKESARFNEAATFIEVLGLLLVAAVGMFFIGNADVNYFAAPSGINGIIIATAIIFFAFIGFEEVANISEETKNPTRTIPKALILSVVISTILYMLVAVSSISILGWEKLSQSKAPLSDVIGNVIPNASILMTVIALFATSNTVLVILIVTSRIFYGISCNHSLPKALSRIGKRGTPYISVFLVMALALASLLIGGIEIIAMLTVFGIFIVYLFVNLSVIRLRYNNRKKRAFRTPVNIGKFPVLAFLGAISSLFMLYFILMYFIF